MNQYQEPRRIYMSDDKLNDLEEQRNRIMERCARRWGVIRDIDEDRYWIEMLPQALFDTLESYDPYLAITAAAAFLKLHGYTVDKARATPKRAAPKMETEVDEDRLGFGIERES